MIVGRLEAGNGFTINKLFKKKAVENSQAANKWQNHILLPSKLLNKIHWHIKL